MGCVIAVCVSERKGTVKQAVPFCEVIGDFGLKGDAHAGRWHRQVSLLMYERFDRFRAESGLLLPFGTFGENLLVSGIDFSALPVGTRLHAGGVILEMTQIGKECHSGCEIARRTGKCIMPTEGVFARVLRGGRIAPGDFMEAELPAR